VEKQAGYSQGFTCLYRLIALPEPIFRLNSGDFLYSLWLNLFDLLRRMFSERFSHNLCMDL